MLSLTFEVIKSLCSWLENYITFNVNSVDYKKILLQFDLLLNFSYKNVLHFCGIVDC